MKRARASLLVALFATACSPATPRSRDVEPEPLVIPPLRRMDGGGPGDGLGIVGPSGRRVGDRVHVEWHGDWYPAVLLEPRDGGWLVHYAGYGSDWDEVVAPDRVRTAPPPPPAQREPAGD